MKISHLALSFALALTTCASYAQEKLVTEKETGSVSSFTSKDKNGYFTVSLKDQGGSTGYTWKYTNSNPAVLTPAGDSTISSERFPAGKPGMTGVPADHRFRFKLTGAKGSAKLTFELRRSWEKDQPAAETYTYTVSMKGSKKAKKKK